VDVVVVVVVEVVVGTMHNTSAPSTELMS